MSNIGNKQTMAENLSYYVERSGRTQKDLAAEVGVAYSTFNDWINGKKYPRIDKIEMLADLFGILKSDLIEDKRMKEQPEEMAMLAASILRDSDLLDMIQKYQKLSEKNKIAVPEGGFAEPVYEEPVEDYFAQISGGQDDFIDDLTEEDRTYLRLKWGKAYKPEEWIKLEQLYEEMMSSYDVQGAGHIDTLKLICKTSLKANQLIDIGDIEGFQKMSKVYNDLMKSGKFTAAQNKAESGEFVDSIGELIEMCEKQGYIERYYIESPKDRVDLTIADMQRYTRTLVEEETNLTLMVEKALRDIEKEDKDNAENTEDSIVDDLIVDLSDIEKTIKDSDFTEFDEFLEEEAAADADYLSGETE